MQVVDEVVNAAWVIPVETDEVFQNHSVVVHDGEIVEILPSDEVAKKYTPKTTTDLPPNTALMPGFVNTHTHTPMVFLRGLSDDIPLREWLEGTICPLEFKFVNHEFVREGTELAIAEMLMAGVTTFNDMYWFPEAVCEAVVKTGIRAAVGIIAIEFPFAGYGTGPDDYFAKGKAARERFIDEKLISWTVSLHAPYTCSDATMSKAKVLVDELKVPLHIHLHETEAEVVESKAGNRESQSCHLSDQKSTPIANMRRLGLVNEHLVAVHMNHLCDEEIDWLAQSKATVVHCPCSGCKLASGFCRVHDLNKAGVNVALGTDGASSNNTLDMMAEMKLAAILAKGVSKDAKAVPASTALRMATLHGAKALGLDEVTGSLKAGKDADMVAVTFSSPAVWPAPTVSDPKLGFDPVTHLVYSSSRDQVTDVWVRGRRLLKSRELQTLSIPDLQKSAEARGKMITEALKDMRCGVCK
jgi:5-methylthioadenosine/S-adenosylhomocysteine deaminase